MRLALIITGIVFILAACTAAGDVSHTCTGEELAAEACTEQYDPVCGSDDQTYSNGCMACASGNVTGYDEGACEVAEDFDHFCTPDEQAAEVCTQEYAPVCGSDGMTYSNGCVACTSGVDAYNQGAC